MGYLNVTNITIEESITHVSKPFTLTIQFECLKPLNDEVEWKFIYVGDSHDVKHDQVLDTIVMDQVEYGCNEFSWEVDQPKYDLVPDQTEILDSTIIMVEASFKEKLFFRCSYLIRHFYKDQELSDNPPDAVNFDMLFREILLANPIVTIYELAWKDILDENYVQGQNIDTVQFKNINMLEEEKTENIGQDRAQIIKEIENQAQIA